jgi:hypothetical protein
MIVTLSIIGIALIFILFKTIISYNVKTIGVIINKTTDKDGKYHNVLQFTDIIGKDIITTSEYTTSNITNLGEHLKIIYNKNNSYKAVESKKLYKTVLLLIYVILLCIYFDALCYGILTGQKINAILLECMVTVLCSFGVIPIVKICRCTCITTGTLLNYRTSQGRNTTAYFKIVQFNNYCNNNIIAESTLPGYIKPKLKEKVKIIYNPNNNYEMICAGDAIFHFLLGILCEIIACSSLVIMIVTIATKLVG